MPVIDRRTFLQEAAGKELDIIKLTNDVTEGHELFELKTQLLALDGNKDGKLRGEAEMAQIFTLLNSVEGATNPILGAIYRELGLVVDGKTLDDDTFTTITKAGSPTEAGRAHDAVLGIMDPESHLEADLAAARSFGQKVGLAGKRYLERCTNQHYDRIETTGIGRYFGNQSEFAHLSPAERQAYLLAHAKEDTHPAAPKQTSCIEWGMEVLEAAYQGANKAARWKQILAIVRQHKYAGMYFLIELQKDGWDSVYWICDDRHIPETGASYTLHSTDLRTVQSKKSYYGVAVKHVISNYRPNRDGNIPQQDRTPLDLSGVERLRKVPFFIGVAKRGMHCFVGRDGRVNEQHWDRDPIDKLAIQERPFEVFGWTSGLLMVPPGCWPTD